MRRPWGVLGVSVGSTGVAHGPPVGCPWAVHGATVRRVWGTYGSVSRRCVVCGHPMGCPWGSPWGACDVSGTPTCRTHAVLMASRLGVRQYVCIGIVSCIPRSTQGILAENHSGGRRAAHGCSTDAPRTTQGRPTDNSHGYVIGDPRATLGHPMDNTCEAHGWAADGRPTDTPRVNKVRCVGYTPETYARPMSDA